MRKALFDILDVLLLPACSGAVAFRNDKIHFPSRLSVSYYRKSSIKPPSQISPPFQRRKVNTPPLY